MKAEQLCPKCGTLNKVFGLYQPTGIVEKSPPLAIRCIKCGQSFQPKATEVEPCTTPAAS